jgi:flagellar FliJ protein
MATDKFRLQRLLELREKHEQALAGRLGDAERQAIVERDSEEQIRVARLASAAEMLAARDGRRVGELRPLATLMDRLDVHLESQRGRVQEAEQVVADAQRVLTEAHKERRVLDKLRERHTDRTRLEAQQADQKTMDDIAMARFLRSDTKD